MTGNTAAPAIEAARWETIAGVRAAVLREVPNLERFPALLGQQLVNRLTWDDATAGLALSIGQTLRTEGRNWLRRRFPSEDSALHLQTFSRSHAAVLCCTFNRDGTRLVVGRRNGTIDVWDPSTGELLAELRGHHDRVAACALLDDGDTVVTASWDGELRAWSIGAPSLLGIVARFGSPLNAVATVPGSGAVLTAGPQLPPALVPVVPGDPSGEEVHAAPDEFRGIATVAVSPDGSVAACGHGSGVVSLWRVDGLLLFRILEGHSDLIGSVCFSPDGSRLAAGDGAGMVRVWDWRTGAEVSELEAHPGELVNGCTADPTGEWWITAGDDGTVRLLPTGRGVPAALRGHRRPVTCCAADPTGSIMATGSDDGTIRTWRLGAANPEGGGATEWGHRSFAVASSFSEDGSVAVTGSRHGDMAIWDVKTGAVVGTLGPQPGLEWCEVSPDGTRVISGGAGAMLWDVASGRSEAAVAWGPEVLWCGFSPDGEVIAAIDRAGKQYWDLTEPDPPFVTRTGLDSAGDARRETASEIFDRPILSLRCAFSPLGSRLVTPGRDGAVLLWEVDADRPQVLGRHDGEEWVYACAWDPGGRVVASGGPRGLIRLWDVHERTEIGTIDAGATVNHLVFAAAGLLVSTGYDDVVKVWDTVKGSMRCCYPSSGNTFLSSAASPVLGLLCVTDIAGEVTWLALE